MERIGLMIYSMNFWHGYTTNQASYINSKANYWTICFIKMMNLSSKLLENVVVYSTFSVSISRISNCTKCNKDFEDKALSPDWITTLCLTICVCLCKWGKRSQHIQMTLRMNVECNVAAAWWQYQPYAMIMWQINGIIPICIAFMRVRESYFGNAQYRSPCLWNFLPLNLFPAKTAWMILV